MWKWTRKASAFLLVFVVLAAGVSCTSEESLGPSTEQPSQSLGSLLSSLHLLSCSSQAVRRHDEDCRHARRHDPRRHPSSRHPRRGARRIGDHQGRAGVGQRELGAIQP